MVQLSSGISSVRIDSYKKMLADLPKRIQDQAQARYDNYFSKDPFHPCLEPHTFVHRLDNRQVHRVSVASWYRALAFIEENDGTRTFVWFWIGSHEQYNGYVAQNLTS